MQDKQVGRNKYSNTIKTTDRLLSTKMRLHGKPGHSPDSFPMGGGSSLQEEHFTGA